MAVIAKCIDHICALSGKIAAWLCLGLIGELVYDTVARYGFNAPTEWSYDVSYMLCGTLFMIGASWTLLQGEHVRIGILYDRASPRVQAAHLPLQGRAHGAAHRTLGHLSRHGRCLFFAFGLFMEWVGIVLLILWLPEMMFR